MTRSRSQKESAKAKRELAAFMKFVDGTGLSIVNAHNLRPPDVDIRCTISGVEIDFEMVEVIDEGMAQQWGEFFRNNVPLEGGSYEEPFAEKIHSKLTRPYESSRDRIELLAWVDRRSVQVDPRPIFWQRVRRMIRIDLVKSRFSRVWVYGQPDSALVLVEPPVVGLTEMFSAEQEDHLSTNSWETT